jgi:hypothetical protein
MNEKYRLRHEKLTLPMMGGTTNSPSWISCCILSLLSKNLPGTKINFSSPFTVCAGGLAATEEAAGGLAATEVSKGIAATG